jgi:hypothetical protein
VKVWSKFLKITEWVNGDGGTGESIIEKATV